MSGSHFPQDALLERAKRDAERLSGALAAFAVGYRKGLRDARQGAARLVPFRGSTDPVSRAWWRGYERGRSE